MERIIFCCVLCKKSLDEKYNVTSCSTRVPREAICKICGQKRTCDTYTILK